LNVDDIRILFPSISVFSNGFMLYEDIIPDKYIYENKIKNIPNLFKEDYGIKFISVFLNSKFEMIAVKLDNNKHPNCSDEGWFCLGEMENKKTNKKTIIELINCIKIFNLDNCYKYPSWFEQKKVLRRYLWI